MKRVGTLVGIAALLMVYSCAQQGQAYPTQLSGAYDLQLVGELLFVNSADRNELRVLDLLATPYRDFVRAPDPVEPLSIPVVERPVGLTKDVHYEDIVDAGFVIPGLEIDGPFIYVRSAAQGSISVVDGTRTGVAPTSQGLIEILELTPESAGLDGPVSAMCARGPDFGATVSTLYYATDVPGQSELWSVSLDSNAIGDGGLLAPPTPTKLLSLPNEHVVALLTMPAHTEIAVATRTDGTAGVGGRTFLLDTGTLAETPLNFPAPVRLLYTHSAYVVGADGGSGFPYLVQGARIFGVLDAESCGGSVPCTGILAVDAVDPIERNGTDRANAGVGQISLDFSGAPMLTLTPVTGLIQSMTLTPAGSAAIPTQVNGLAAFDLLGLGTSSNGEIFFFDADDLTEINGDALPPVLGTTTLFAADAGVLFATSATDGVQGPITLTEGAINSEVVSVTYQGFLPGLTGLPASPANGPEFFVPNLGVLPQPDGGGEVFPGDLVELSDADGGCGELQVATIDFAGGGLITTGTTECTDFTSFGVRASGANPYVVSGNVSGFMTRTQPAPTETPIPVNIQLPYYFRPAPQLQLSSSPPLLLYVPGTPAISFFMGPQDPVVTQDSNYEFTITADYLADNFTLDTTVSFPGFVLPGSIVQNLGVTVDAFVAYPSANAIVEFDPAHIAPGAANGVSAGVLAPYR